MHQTGAEPEVSQSMVSHRHASSTVNFLLLDISKFNLVTEKRYVSCSYDHNRRLMWQDTYLPQTETHKSSRKGMMKIHRNMGAKNRQDGKLSEAGKVSELDPGDRRRNSVF